MKVRIASVKIPHERLRELDRSKLPTFANSMKRRQLQPIGITRDGTLVYGLHRLLAARDILGWDEIWAETVPESEDASDRVLDEIDENLIRSDLSQLERWEHWTLREAIYRERGLKKPHGRPRKGAEFARLRSNADVADEVGVSERLYEQGVKAYVKLSPVTRSLIRGTPIEDNQEELYRLSRRSHEEQFTAAVLIKSGVASGVREALRENQRASTKLLAKEVAPLDSLGKGTFRTIVLDPPWSPEITGDVDPGGKLAPVYPTMSLEEIEALPVGDLAEDGDAHLYLWVTGDVLLTGAVPRLLEAWGFTEGHRQLLTWRKHRPGVGRYYRRQTEFVVFAMRGTRLLTTQAYTDIFDGERTVHSSKPATFFEMVAEASPGPRLEMFSREHHEGYRSWGTGESAVGFGGGMKEGVA